MTTLTNDLLLPKALDAGGPLGWRSLHEAVAARLRVHRRILELYERHARMEYFRLNQEIHLEIVRVARNDLLRSIHTRLHARMKRIRFRGNDSPENWAQAVADHQEIVQGLLRRDGASVGAALQRHLEASWVRLANSLHIDPETFEPLDQENKR